METTNQITIQAPIDVVFALGADTERWPDILPHYRWVRRRAGTDLHKIVEMACWRRFGGPVRYPVRWVAEQRTMPTERRITFKHLRGISRGMDVEWRLTETPLGTHVLIWHEFHSDLPLVGELFACRIVGDLFVSAIATTTLRRIKHLAEAGLNQQAAGSEDRT